MGDAEKFPQAFAVKSLDSFLRVSEPDSCLTAVEEDGDAKRRVQLELARKADGVASPDPV